MFLIYFCSYTFLFDCKYTLAIIDKTEGDRLGLASEALALANLSALDPP